MITKVRLLSEANLIINIAINNENPPDFHKIKIRRNMRWGCEALKKAVLCHKPASASCNFSKTGSRKITFLSLSSRYIPGNSGMS